MAVVGSDSHGHRHDRDHEVDVAALGRGNVGSHGPRHFEDARDIRTVEGISAVTLVATGFELSRSDRVVCELLVTLASLGSREKNDGKTLRLRR